MRDKFYTIVIPLVILGFAGFFIGSLLLTEKSAELQITKPPIEELSQGQQTESSGKSFMLTGWILEIDRENNFLTVKSERDGSVFRGLVDEHTGMLKMNLPEELPTERMIINLVQTEINLADLQGGDYIYLVTRDNPISVTELNEVNRIRFYPFVAAFEDRILMEKTEETLKPCGEFPFWNSSGKCYLVSTWRADASMTDIYEDIDTSNGGAALAICFYQIRNRANDDYVGPEKWQSFDCHGSFYIEEKIVLDMSPDGDCYVEGEKACQFAAVVATQSDMQAFGRRYYNIEL